MSEQFDVIIIGGGPGGYVCAIRCAQLGLKTACVEKRGALGGTCLNVGCIPSKALLESSHHYEDAKHNFADHGVKIGDMQLDLSAMMKRKDDVVSQLTKGIEFLLKKNKVEYIRGEGSVIAPGKVKAGGSEYTTKNIVIATGSEVVNLPGLEIDEEKIVSSTGALKLKKVPEHLLIVGAGVIGLELGSVWRRLGAEVTVVEFLDHITPGLDKELAKDFQKSLEKQGVKFKLSHKVTGAAKDGEKLIAKIEPSQGGDEEQISCDNILVAIGRRPYTDGLNLSEAGVELDDKKRIKTDDHFKTNLDGIYAIGDVIKGPMLAHKAEDEGVVLAEILAGQSGHINYDAIPSVIYTHPEVASVGKTEEELKEAGIEYNKGKFLFGANGRALANGDAEGYVKVLADKKTDQVLGAHIIGPDAGTLIAEMGLAIEFSASSEDVARTCHAHPTLNEVIKEAALAVEKRALHG